MKPTAANTTTELMRSAETSSESTIEGTFLGLNSTESERALALALDSREALAGYLASAVNSMGSSKDGRLEIAGLVDGAAMQRALRVACLSSGRLDLLLQMQQANEATDSKCFGDLGFVVQTIKELGFDLAVLGRLSPSDETRSLFSPEDLDD